MLETDDGGVEVGVKSLMRGARVREMLLMPVKLLPRGLGGKSHHPRKGPEHKGCEFTK